MSPNYNSSTPLHSQSQTALLLNNQQYLQKRTMKSRLQHPRNPRTNSSNSKSSTTSDRNQLHHVPDDVLDAIFSFLPIKSAMQVGMRSKRFKATWVFSKNLCFDQDFARNLTRVDFISVVNRVFKSHDAGSSIRSLRLVFDPNGSEPTVLKWVESSIEKGVEELDLDFVNATVPFRIPSDFLDVQTVRTLKLSCCVLNLPAELRGLGLLTTVVLRKVTLADGTIEALTSSCLNLESLDLAQCCGLHRLRVSAVNLKKFKELRVGQCYELRWTDIQAPTLVSLYYSGPILTLNTLDSGVSNRLNDVVLTFSPSKGFTHFSEMEKLASHHLSNVTVLTITSTFLEGLTTRVRDGVFRDLQFCLWNLKELQLFMEGASYCNLSDIASFMANCPRIEKLFIDLNDFTFECGAYWELHQKQSVESYTAYFSCLKFMKLKGFKFEEHQVEVVRFFLGRALFLEAMVLVFPKNGFIAIQPVEASFYGRLFRSSKASSETKILVYEHWNDITSSPQHSRVWF